MIIDEEVYLEHHGIKGMRWGVRNDYKKKGRGKGSGAKKGVTKASDAKQESLKEYSKTLEQKYGKGSLSGSGSSSTSQNDEGFRLTPAEKKALIIGGSAIGLALAAGVVYYGVRELGAAKEITKALSYLDEASNMEIFKNPGLIKNWDNAIELPKGTILQRMSTMKETSIRPDGFFAAYTKSDVEHYKAVLPKFWKMWGYKETSGYLTQLKSSKAIKAPSGKETFEIFKKTFRNEDMESEIRRFTTANIKLSPEQKDQATSAIARRYFNSFATHWTNDAAKSDPTVQKFFKEVQSRGYNAVIDFNDSSRLADTPLRLLDGNDFSIVGNNPVSESDIKAAYDNTGLLFDGDGGIFGDAPVFAHSNFFLNDRADNTASSINMGEIFVHQMSQVKLIDINSSRR